MSQIEFRIVKDGVGVITLNRPEKRNAFTTAMRESLTEVLRSEEIHELRAVVLRAEGTVFSAGADLKEVGNHDTWPARAAASRLLTAFRRTAPVIIAAVNGPALGLGSGIAMAADMVVASETAEFGYPEVEHGLVAALTMVGLKELVGQRQAFELLVTGRRIKAEEALRIGMINEIVPAKTLDNRALELAEEVAARGSLAVQTTKRFFYEIEELTHSASMQSAERVIELVRKSKVAQAQTQAFSERKTSSEGANR